MNVPNADHAVASVDASLPSLQKPISEKAIPDKDRLFENIVDIKDASFKSPQHRLSLLKKEFISTANLIFLVPEIVHLPELKSEYITKMKEVIEYNNCQELASKYLPYIHNFAIDNSF